MGLVLSSPEAAKLVVIMPRRNTAKPISFRPSLSLSLCPAWLSWDVSAIFKVSEEKQYVVWQAAWVTAPHFSKWAWLICRVEGCEVQARVILTGSFACLPSRRQAKRLKERVWVDRWNVMVAIFPLARSVRGGVQNDHPLALAGPGAGDDWDKHWCDVAVSPGRTTFYSCAKSLSGFWQVGSVSQPLERVILCHLQFLLPQTALNLSAARVNKEMPEKMLSTSSI